MSPSKKNTSVPEVGDIRANLDGEVWEIIRVDPQSVAVKRIDCEEDTSKTISRVEWFEGMYLKDELTR